MLLYFQKNLNNFKNQFIEMSLNEILYNFNIRNTFEFLIKLLSQYYIRLRQFKRNQIEIFLIFINIIIKFCYNKLYNFFKIFKKI